MIAAPVALGAAKLELLAALHFLSHLLLVPEISQVNSLRVGCLNCLVQRHTLAMVGHQATWLRARVLVPEMAALGAQVVAIVEYVAALVEVELFLLIV